MASGLKETSTQISADTIKAYEALAEGVIKRINNDVKTRNVQGLKNLFLFVKKSPNANILKNSPSFLSAMFEAVKLGYDDVLATFIEILEFSPDAQLGNETSLMLAAHCGHVKTVYYLLGKNANPNLKNKHGQTALHFATQESSRLSSPNFDPNQIADYQKRCTLIVQALLSKKADPNVHDEIENTTPLLFAIQCNNTASATLLLKAGASLESENCEGFTTGMFIMLPQYFEKNKFLISEAQKKGYSINSRNKNGLDLLQFALMHNINSEALKFLLDQGATVTDQHIKTCIRGNQLENLRFLFFYSKMPIDQRFNDNKITALMMAANLGNQKVVKFLLELKADPNLQTDEGYTALTFACRKFIIPEENLNREYDLFETEHLQCVELLLKAKADINLSPHLAATPAMMAVLCGNPDILERLLQCRPDLSKKFQPTDSTPNTLLADILALATISPNERCFDLVLKAYQDAKLAIENFTILLDTAIHTGQLHKVQTFIKFKTQGQNTEQTSLLIQDAYITAIRFNQVPLMEWLETQGADPNAVDTRLNKGYTALMYAALEGHAAVISRLISSKAKVNAQSVKGSTALIHACKTGQTDAVRALLELGADSTLKDTAGRDALYYASANNFPEVVKLLCEYNKQSKNFDINAKDQHGISVIMMAPTLAMAKMLKKYGATDNSLFCCAQLILSTIEEDLERTKELLELNDPNSTLGLPAELFEEIQVYSLVPIYLFSNTSKKIETRFLFLQYKLYSNFPNIAKAKIDQFIYRLQKIVQDFVFSMDGDLIINLQYRGIQYALSLSFAAQKSLLNLPELPKNFDEAIIKYSHESAAIASEARIRSFIEEILSLLAKGYQSIVKPFEVLQEFEKDSNKRMILKDSELENLKLKIEQACNEMQAIFSAIQASIQAEQLFTKDDPNLFDQLITKLKFQLERCYNEIEVPWTKFKELIAVKQQQLSKAPAQSIPQFIKTDVVQPDLKTEKEFSGRDLKSKIEKLEAQRKAELNKPSAVQPAKKPFVPPKTDPKLLSDAFKVQPRDINYSDYLKLPKPLTLNMAAGNISEHLRALEGRQSLIDTLAKISEPDDRQSSLLQQRPLLTVQKLIKFNATLGALAQALETRKGLGEEWPNAIRDVLFHFEESLVSFVKDEQALISIIKKIEAKFTKISENELLKNRGKLSLKEIDEADFLQNLCALSSKIPTYNEARAKNFVKKSQEELELFKKYIQENSKTASEDQVLKQAIGFTLARAGTYLMILQKNGVNINHLYPDLCRYIPLAADYRHVGSQWQEGVDKFIQSCLNPKSYLPAFDKPAKTLVSSAGTKLQTPPSSEAAITVPIESKKTKKSKKKPKK